MFILFLVIEIFICTIIILWEISSSTRKQCAPRRNRQLFSHAHIMSTTENKKYDILLWMSRTELSISKSEQNRIEPNRDFYTIFDLWYCIPLLAGDFRRWRHVRYMLSRTRNAMSNTTPHIPPEFVPYCFSYCAAISTTRSETVRIPRITEDETVKYNDHNLWNSYSFWSCSRNSSAIWEAVQYKLWWYVSGRVRRCTSRAR